MSHHTQSWITIHDLSCNVCGTKFIFWFAFIVGSSFGTIRYLQSELSVTFLVSRRPPSSLEAVFVRATETTGTGQRTYERQAQLLLLLYFE